MTPLSKLTRRNFLIAAHDALATAFALLAAFYLRFEGGEAFFARLPLLLHILPFFVAFAAMPASKPIEPSSVRARLARRTHSTS